MLGWHFILHVTCTRGTLSTMIMYLVSRGIIRDQGHSYCRGHGGDHRLRVWHVYPPVPPADVLGGTIQRQGMTRAHRWHQPSLYLTTVSPIHIRSILSSPRQPIYQLSPADILVATFSGKPYLGFPFRFRIMEYAMIVRLSVALCFLISGKTLLFLSRNTSL